MAKRPQPPAHLFDELHASLLDTSLFSMLFFINSQIFQEGPQKNPAPEPKNYIYTQRAVQESGSRTNLRSHHGLQDIIEQPNAKDTPDGNKADREERGVGMQNFKYAPAYDEFCNVVRINSPAAYRALQDHLPGRSERSFR
ncbi:hypothetical protein B0H14DRAFT_2568628 [Mycena olivaceomarginata]|nr:hypothetical protein B0H14DRAFT_2568628 [Mycena olivaceomarginata]